VALAPDTAPPGLPYSVERRRQRDRKQHSHGLPKGHKHQHRSLHKHTDDEDVTHGVEVSGHAPCGGPSSYELDGACEMLFGSCFRAITSPRQSTFGSALWLISRIPRASCVARCSGRTSISASTGERRLFACGLALIICVVFCSSLFPDNETYVTEMEREIYNVGLAAQVRAYCIDCAVVVSQDAYRASMDRAFDTLR
jgi:hypothetical protein